jgi:hypothetical protein
VAWKPGQSGNPAGRRADSVITRGRARIAKSLLAVIDVVVQQALAGDVASQKLLLERMIPIARPDYEELLQRITDLESRHDENAD